MTYRFLTLAAALAALASLGLLSLVQAENERVHLMSSMAQ
jgi:hypothetical protein